MADGASPEGHVATDLPASMQPIKKSSCVGGVGAGSGGVGGGSAGAGVHRRRRRVDEDVGEVGDWCCAACKSDVLNPHGSKFAKKIFRLGEVVTKELGVLELRMRLDKRPRCLELLLTQERETAAEKARRPPGKRGPKPRTIGYVLIEVDEGHRILFRGLHVKDDSRGLGMGALLLACFFAFARRVTETGVSAVGTDGDEAESILSHEDHAVDAAMVGTKIIDKPVLCLLLQKCGFVPDEGRGHIAVDILDIEPNTVAVHSTPETGSSVAKEVLLYSDDIKRLRSTFSKSFCKAQRMRIVSEEERATLKVRGATTVVAMAQFVPGAGYSEAVRKVFEALSRRGVRVRFSSCCRQCFSQILQGPILAERETAVHMSDSKTRPRRERATPAGLPVESE